MVTPALLTVAGLSTTSELQHTPKTLAELWPSGRPPPTKARSPWDPPLFHRSHVSPGAHHRDQGYVRGAQIGTATGWLENPARKALSGSSIRGDRQHILQKVRVLPR